MAVDFRDRSADDARAWFGALPQSFPSLAADRNAYGHPRSEFGDNMAEMARRIPDATHVRVPGTGHLVHAGAPDAYRAAIEAFLATDVSSSQTLGRQCTEALR